MAKFEQVQKTIKGYFKKQNFAHEEHLLDNNTWMLITAFQSQIQQVGNIAYIISEYEKDLNTTAAIRFQDLKSEQEINIVEFLSRINNNIKRGYYGFDYDIKQVSFRFWYPFDKSKFSNEDILNLLTLGIGSIEILWPWLIQVINSEMTPIEATQAYINAASNPPQAIVNDKNNDATEDVTMPEHDTPVTLQNEG